MPSNHFKEDQKCYQWLGKILSNIPPSGMNINVILIDSMKLFPVSERKVRAFLEKNVSVGTIIIDEDMITKNKN